jgi:sortase A
MRKFMFALVMLLGVAIGIYLGLQYPPDIVCGSLSGQEASLPGTPAFGSISPNTLATTPTPTAMNEEQFYFNSTPDSATTVTTEPAPLNNDSESDSYDILGQLMIGAESITVRNNVDEATLRQSPGWMSDSALPGEDGMCVILGHRNRNHLKVLENVEVGDEIIFRYPDNRSATYTVIEIQIFEETADWTLPQSDDNLLVIVTCYPFQYSGSAPGKFQVVCNGLND